jgi:hypothetical protein
VAIELSTHSLGMVEKSAPNLNIFIEKLQKSSKNAKKWVMEIAIKTLWMQLKYKFVLKALKEHN